MKHAFNHSIAIVAFIFMSLYQVRSVSANKNIEIYGVGSNPTSASLAVEDTTRVDISNLESESQIGQIEETERVNEAIVELEEASTFETSLSTEVSDVDTDSISLTFPSAYTSLAVNQSHEEYSIPWTEYNTQAPHESAQFILDTFLTERSRYEDFTNILTLNEDFSALQDFGNELDYKEYQWTMIDVFTLELYGPDDYFSFLIKEPDLGLVYLVEYVMTDNSTDEEAILQVNIVEYQIAL